MYSGWELRDRQQSIVIQTNQEGRNQFRSVRGTEDPKLGREVLEVDVEGSGDLLSPALPKVSACGSDAAREATDRRRAETASPKPPNQLQCWATKKTMFCAGRCNLHVNQFRGQPCLFNVGSAPRRGSKAKVESQADSCRPCRLKMRLGICTPHLCLVRNSSLAQFGPFNPVASLFPLNNRINSVSKGCESATSKRGREKRHISK